MKMLLHIPFKIKIKILFSSKIIYLALSFLVIPSTMLIAFLPDIDFMDRKFINYSTNETKGVLTSINETGNTVNRNKAYRYYFDFYQDENLVKGNSYGFETNFNIGDTVAVEYLSNDFTTSRIVDTKNGSFNIDTLGFFFYFIVIGLVLLIIVTYRKVNLIKTLKSGFEILPTQLRLELKTPSLPLGKSNLFYRLTFEYNISEYSYSKVIYISADDHSIRRIRRSNIIVDALNYSKSNIIETLPIDVRNYIINEIIISNKSKPCTT